MYAFLFDSLGPVLKVAVGAYVVVIALMAAQAIGRATLLRDRAAVAVAVGAGFFMLSDSLLATNKFAFAAADGAVLGAGQLLRRADPDRAACAGLPRPIRTRSVEPSRRPWKRHAGRLIPYSWTRVPSSITQLFGSRRKSATLPALRDMNANSPSRQCAMPARRVGTMVSRLRK